MPRLRTALVVCVLGLVTVGCGSTGGTAGDPDTRACRADWESLRQTWGENGNPADAGTVLAGRYDEMAQTAARLARSAARPDCPGRLDTLSGEMDVLFGLASVIGSFDMPQVLRRAEADLAHALDTRDYDPVPPRLAAAFRVLRARAAAAARDLDPVLDRAARVDLTEQAAETAQREIDAAAAGSSSYRACRRALRVIGTFELDEE